MLQSFNDFIWTYILVGLLIACGLWFTWKTKFVQFRMLREMIRLLKDSGTREEHEGNSQKGKSGIIEKTKHITSFQAFAVSLATRVGTGNMAGVATAIAIGGPGACF